MVPGPGRSPSGFLLVLLGAGGRAVGYKVAAALAPAGSLLGGPLVTRTSTSTSHESLKIFSHS